ncbi:MAG: Serine/threonine-protein kinase PrkC [Planctomycetota bacterium]
MNNSADGAPSARQQAIEDLFDVVRGLPPEEREAQLAAAPVTEAVRAEVRSLLAFDGDTVHIASSSERSIAFDANSCLGVSVDGFTIRAVIGSGGMGTVFEAEQERPQRLVALKVLRATSARPSTARRFLQESNFLARLDHPNIARVIAAGIMRTADATERPYFAMELVEDGRAITRWMQETSPSRELVLAKFAEACDAVGAGHRAGIAHLDLKPSNLLIGADGRVRVIDYGIARSLERADQPVAPLSRESLEQGVVGTPQYMSPEQFSRDHQAIDSRADVYALGLILYELTTGRLPYETRGLSFQAIAQRVRDAQPVAPRLVDAHVPRPLDAIIRRAIARNPASRYGTASELADDLRRFLADEPVVAEPMTRVESIARVVRKNKALASLAVFAFVASLVAAVVAWNAAIDSERASKRSERLASLANLRSATAALRESDPAEAARLLDRVRMEDRNWEARHLMASIARHELYAPLYSEILHLAVAGETGEVACGVTSGFVVIVDPKNPEPYEIHDLRADFGDFANKYFPNMAISANGRRVLAPLGSGKLMELDRDRGTWREISGGGPWCADADGATVVADYGSIMFFPKDATTPSSRVAFNGSPLHVSIARGARHAAVQLADGTIVMYEIDAVQGVITERWRTKDVFRRPRTIAVADDGSAVVAVSRDPEIVRLNGRDGAMERRGELAGGAVFEIAFARGGETVAASSWANTIRVIDANTLEIREFVGGTLGHVWGIDYSPDDSRIVGRVIVPVPDPTSDRDVMEWLGGYRIGNPGGTRDFDIGRDVLAACAEMNEGKIYLVDIDGQLGALHTDDGVVDPIGTVGVDARLLRHVALAAGNDIGAVESFYIGMSTGVVVRFDRTSDGSIVERWRTPVFSAGITALEISPDQTSVACGTRERTCVVLEAASGEERWRSALPVGTSGTERQRVSGVAFIDDGQALVPFSVDSLCHIPVLSLRDGRELRVFSPECVEVESFVSASPERFLGVGVTGAMHAFREGQPIAATNVARNGGIISALPSDDRFLLAARDGLLRVLSIKLDESAEFQRPLRGIEDLMRLDLPAGIALAVGFNPTRDEVAVLSNRGRLRVWSGRVDPASVPRAGVGQLEALKRDEARRGSS